MDSLINHGKETFKMVYEASPLEMKRTLVHAFVYGCVACKIDKEVCAEFLKYTTGYDPLIEDIRSLIDGHKNSNTQELKNGY